MISKDQMELALTRHHDRSNEYMDDFRDSDGAKAYMASHGLELNEVLHFAADYAGNIVGGPIREMVVTAIDKLGPEMAMATLMSPHVLTSWVASSFHEGMVVGMILGRQDAAKAHTELDQIAI